MNSLFPLVRSSQVGVVAGLPPVEDVQHLPRLVHLRSGVQAFVGSVAPHCVHLRGSFLVLRAFGGVVDVALLLHLEDIGTG